MNGKRRRMASRAAAGTAAAEERRCSPRVPHLSRPPLRLRGAQINGDLKICDRPSDSRAATRISIHFSCRCAQHQRKPYRPRDFLPSRNGHFFARPMTYRPLNHSRISGSLMRIYARRLCDGTEFTYASGSDNKSDDSAGACDHEIR